MLVEQGYSRWLGTLGETVKTWIYDFERAWKIFKLKSIEKDSLHKHTCFKWWNLAIAINMFEHVCLMQVSWLVMSYAALTFSIDPQIDRKDNDTFFQFCPRGVQFKFSYIQVMFVSDYQEVQRLLVYKPAGYLASVKINKMSKPKQYGQTTSRDCNGSTIVGHALKRSSIHTKEWSESETDNISEAIPCRNHLEPHYTTSYSTRVVSLMVHENTSQVKMLQQDTDCGNDCTTSPDLTSIYHQQPTAETSSFLFHRVIPDTWEVEVLVPLLVVVALDVLEVLEVLDVREVLEVVEDVDVWTKRRSYVWHMRCLLYPGCWGTRGETGPPCVFMT